MANTLRTNSVITQESLADLQYLEKIARNQKERIDYQIAFFRRRVEFLTRKINATKADFQSYLLKNGLDQNYPVLAKVLNDDTLTDIAPENGLTAVNIEEARSRNFPQESMQLVEKNLVEKYLDILKTVNFYIQQLYGLRLEKARMASFLDRAMAFSKDYRENISTNQPYYTELITVLECLNDLLRALLEFKRIFTVVPDGITSQSAIDNQTSNIDRYNVYYVGKKKYIVKMIGRLADALSELEHPELSSESFLKGFREMGGLFSGEDVFPTQYIKAVDNKVIILLNLDSFINLVIEWSNAVKLLLEDVRGTRDDVGNSDLKNLLTVSSGLAKSSAKSSVVSTETLDQVIATNKLSLAKITEHMEDFRKTLQRGVDKLDDKFKSANAWALRGVSQVIGYVVPFDKTGKQCLNDNMREKCRNSYGGNIKFCDEEKIIVEGGRIKYVKLVDYDISTGKEKVQINGEALAKEIKIDKNILSKPQ